MLELKNVSKIYKGTSHDVEALHEVNLYFEESGMVFVTGKSGSGKTTLLNVVGALDNFTDGEILIKGRSTDTFTKADYDSYRNTYVGFVFQEYNLLDDMTIEQNLSLALKLQGKKCGEKEINDILETVDLRDVASRHPKELSGGQRQRVAIARALIKNPSIIMADEPTGALDTENGRQVMELLKNLSKEKLVIVVSHDLELADRFADRIIEMEDGRVVNDVTITPTGDQKVRIFESLQGIAIKRKAELSDDDFKHIKTAVKAGKDVYVTDKIESVKAPTEVKRKQYDGTSTFIKTKLGAKDTIKLGLNTLANKRLRLIITIVLCVFAFTIFGVFDSLSIYNESRMVESAIKYSITPSVVLTAGVKEGNANKYDINVGDAIVSDLSQKTGYDVKGIYDGYFVGTNGSGSSTPLELSNNNAFQISKFFRYKNMHGVVEFSKDDLSNYGFTMSAGRLPVNFDEIAVSRYYAACMINGWYSTKNELNETIPLINVSRDIAGTIDSKLSPDSPAYVDAVVDAVIGVLKEKIERGDALYITIGSTDYSKSYKIVGIVNTGDVDKKFDAFKTDFDGQTIANQNDFYNYMLNGYNLCAFVKEGFVKNAVFNRNTLTQYVNKAYSFTFASDTGVAIGQSNFYRYEALKELTSNYYFLQQGKTDLQGNEFLVDISQFSVMYGDAIDALLQIADTDSYFQNDAENIRAYMRTISDNKSTMGEKQQALMSAIATINNLQSLLHNNDPITYPQSALIAPLSFTAGKLDVNNYQDGTIKPVEVTLDDDQYRLVGFYMGVSVPNTNVISLMLTDDGLNNLGVSLYQGNYSKLIATNVGNGKASQLGKTILEDSTIQYATENNAIKLIELNSEMFAKLSRLFWIASAIFAAFSIVMLWNFISTSIKNKYGEIGILRALGARGSDIMRMFLVETAVIALINAACACLLAWGCTHLVNRYMSDNLNIYIPLANFGIRQILITLAFSLVIGIVSAITPIIRVSKQKPVETIRKAY